MRWLKPSGSWPVRFSLRRADTPEPAPAGRARVYTVASGRPFLAALAEALLGGSLPVRGGQRPGPLQLADTVLYLPTRRATRPLQEAFLKASRGGALLLPKIKPIGAGSEEAELLASVEDFQTAAKPTCRG